MAVTRMRGNEIDIRNIELPTTWKPQNKKPATNLNSLTSTQLKSYQHNGFIVLPDYMPEWVNRYHEGNRQRILLRYIVQAEREKIDSILMTLKMGGDFKKISQMAGAYNENPDEVDISMLSPDIIKAISELETGQYTQEPIKTDKGWLLVLLEGKKKSMRLS